MENRIQLFILSWRNFLNSFSKSLFCVFLKVLFLKTYWLDSGLYLLNWKPKLVAFCGKASFPFHTFDLDMICSTFFLVRTFFVFFVEVVFPQRLMVEVPLFSAILKTSDAENMLSRLLFHAFLILCMKCFPLSFVLRCSVLVAVSFLVSQKRLFCNTGFRVLFRAFLGESDIAFFPYLPLFTFILNL